MPTTRQSPIGAARQVEGDQMQEGAVRRQDAVTGPEKSGMREHERGGHQAFGQQLLRPIEIGSDRVQQPRALTQAARQRLPVVGRDDKAEGHRGPTGGSDPRVAA